MKLMPALVLATSLAAIASAPGETVFEFQFPYATKFAHLSLGAGLGRGETDIDGDGKATEAGRGTRFATPDLPEYGAAQDGTSAGPEIEARAAIASFTGLDPETLKLGDYGFTKNSLRMAPLHAESSVSPDMGVVDYFVIPSTSFRNGQSFEFGPGGLMQAELANAARASVRFLIRAGGELFISEQETNGQTLEIADPANAKWIPYPEGSSGRNLRARPKTSGAASMGTLGPIDGVGLYRELMNFDGNTPDKLQLDLNVTRFSVSK